MAEPTFRQRAARLFGDKPAKQHRDPRTGRKQSPVMQAIIETGTVTARWTQMDYIAMSREGYSGNPYVYAAIRQNARSFAGIRWRAYTDETKRTELDKHPLLDLWKRPNPLQGGSTFREMFLAYLLIDGNSFILSAAPQNKPPTELWCLRPDRVSVIPGNAANPIAGYTYTVGRSKVRLPAETVRHFKLFNPLDDWRGLSPMSPAAKSIDQNNAAKSWNVALLQNGARTTGVVTMDTYLEDEQYQRLKESIAEEYSGFLNAGRPILLENGAKWQDAGMTPKDMDWTQGQKLSSREVAITYNIAPELLGDSENKTYSNYGEARRALYEENILPTCDIFREDINPWLCVMYPDTPFLDYDPADVEALQEDQDAVEGRATRRFQGGYMKVNEARIATGLEEDTGEWGDKYIFELPQRAPAQPESPPESAHGLPGMNPQEQLPPGQQPAQLPPGKTGKEDESGESGQPSGAQDAPTPESEGGADAAQKRIVPFARGRIKTRRFGTQTAG